MNIKNKFSTSIPASLSNFKEEGQLTRATLKVFHKGLTEDGRYFTKSFADKLAATIGGTPVVAKYNSDTDDFEGHAEEQSVFGFVPEAAEIKFETDSTGREWLLTDVRLFTKREDVGSIARKIIGKAQSLELDPENLKYDVIFNDEGDTQINFLDGDLIGLSVLGSLEAPAFSGSGFFKALEDEEFEESYIEKLIAKYNSISKEVVIEDGGESVDKRIIFEYAKFLNVEEDGVIYVEYETDDDKKRKKEELEGIVPVILKPDKDEEELENPEEPTDPEQPTDPEDPEDPEGTEEPADPENPEGTETDTPENGGEGDPVDTGDGDGGDDSGGESVEGSFDDQKTDPNAKVTDKEVEAEEEQAKANASALNEEELEELNSYRRANKEAVINSYSEFLSEETLQRYKDSVDSYTVEELEKELSFESMKVIKSQDTGKPTFSFKPTTRENGLKSEIDSLIEKYNR